MLSMISTTPNMLRMISASPNVLRSVHVCASGHSVRSALSLKILKQKNRKYVDNDIHISKYVENDLRISKCVENNSTIVLRITLQMC